MAKKRVSATEASRVARQPKKKRGCKLEERFEPGSEEGTTRENTETAAVTLNAATDSLDAVIKGVSPVTKFDPHVNGRGPSLNGDWRVQIAEDTFNSTLSDHVKIVCWNVNGLRALLKSRKLCRDKEAKEEGLEPGGDFGEYLRAEQPAIVCLNETKLNERIVDTITAELSGLGYKTRHCLGKKAGYAGVAILIREDTGLDKAVEEVILGCGDERFDDEGRTVAIVFRGLVLVTTYVLNAGQDLKRLSFRVNEYDKHMHAWLRLLRVKYHRPVVWCGDLNCAREEIDIWNSKGNAKSSGHTPEERASLTNFLSAGDFQDVWRRRNPTSRRYTYWSTRAPQQRQFNLGWRLDAFVIAEDLADKVGLVSIRDLVVGSDHCPIVISLPRGAFTNQ